MSGAQEVEPGLSHRAAVDAFQGLGIELELRAIGRGTVCQRRARYLIGLEVDQPHIVREDDCQIHDALDNGVFGLIECWVHRDADCR